ncbi:hypothetical protein ONE63_001553 [Megalurothrips usitatus]|uniref:Uncharacterized protein n=1 Tax=Megalurothrips usitatus TaxID=439358 RepID=A0AAV7XFK9_9NEOP|nr:hypothetical protein ONE63_001553 [Megalurothrips usitatus]
MDFIWVGALQNHPSSLHCGHLEWQPLECPKMQQAALRSERACVAVHGSPPAPSPLLDPQAAAVWLLGPIAAGHALELKSDKIVISRAKDVFFIIFATACSSDKESFHRMWKYEWSSGFRSGRTRPSGVSYAGVHHQPRLHCPWDAVHFPIFI